MKPFYRFILALIVASFMIPIAISFAPRAHADELWSFTDPVIRVDGHVYYIAVGVPLSRAQSVAQLTLYIPTPANSSGMILEPDNRQFTETVILMRNGGDPTESYATATDNKGQVVETNVIVFLIQ